MAPLRKPLQGVWNVVRFNWHFYLLVLVGALVLTGAALMLPAWRGGAALLLALLLMPTLTSLAVSAYVYDFSGLYQLRWLPPAPSAAPALLTVNAGFDEISALLRQRYPTGSLVAVDFYDSARHTEVSIRRARRAYPPAAGTQRVDTRAALPLAARSIDLTFAFLAAHEIRDAHERAVFFRELWRVTRPGGRLVVTEHLRDPANFLAYSIGFLHFHSRRSWLATFQEAGFALDQELKATPFISTFILRKSGAAS